MKKILSDDLTLYFKNRFPYKRNKKSKKTHKVTIGIGGNIGDVILCFNQLFKMLENDSRFSIQSTSAILKNPPFGYLDQNDFYNAVIVLQTNLSPIHSLNEFQRYEKRLKRVRSFQDAPRTIDIDIIFYDKIKLKTKRLTIPHHGYKNRQSVLIPLGFVNVS